MSREISNFNLGHTIGFGGHNSLRISSIKEGNFLTTSTVTIKFSVSWGCLTF